MKNPTEIKKAGQTPTYWKDVEDKFPDPASFKGEFADGELDRYYGTNNSRRDFLKLMGFSFATVPLASSCIRIPVKKALPYLEKSDQVVPGVANWYATAMDPSLGSALLVKTREGRPIKIEGNNSSPITLGGTSAYDQSSVLSLYDSSRFKGPMLDGHAKDWNSIDADLKQKLMAAVEAGKEIALITATQSSPSTLALIEEFKKYYKTTSHTVYEPHSDSAVIAANQVTFGKAVSNRYDLSNANLVVSVNSDFLGAGCGAVEMTKQYSKRKDPDAKKGAFKHIQLETLMTLSGANADVRFTISPAEEKGVLLNILGALQRETKNFYTPTGESLPSEGREAGIKIAEELLQNRGKSLLLSGSHSTSLQVIVNAINNLLGNYGKTLHVYDNPYFKGADDKSFVELVERMDSGKVGAVILWDCNPAYNYSESENFKGALAKVATRVFIGMTPDETSELTTHILPELHYLESWNDYFVAPNTVLYAQAVVRPIFDARQGQDSLLSLMGRSDFSAYLQANMDKNFYKLQSKYATTSGLWDHSIHDGTLQVNLNTKSLSDMDKNQVAHHFAMAKRASASNGFTLLTYQKSHIRQGRMINNPWLLELPDPITKATWMNYLMINPAVARAMGLKTGDVVSLSDGKFSAEVPVLSQPGVHKETVALAVGFGRSVAGKAAKGRGVNAYPTMRYMAGTFQNNKDGFSLTKTGKSVVIPQTQTHHSMEGRDLIRETTLEEYSSNPKAGNEEHAHLISMWGGHEKTGHQWAMAIDLNKCTGCSGCIVSCSAENNVPVVGPEEVANRREMHWIRLDRYYKGDENNPEVSFQPVMCQHCDNAPCETVCPVMATAQSSDGLNQQVYNRCVGTRYCANNCPYKVRRFNWFDYPHDDKYENMVLNPDVVVRSRGVMEKCSMCVHRIQEGKLQAKKDGIDLPDGAIKLACQQSCPADAIVFGDMNDPDSKVSKLLKGPRNYRILEELNVQPRVNYLTKIRNKDESYGRS